MLGLIVAIAVGIVLGFLGATMVSAVLVVVAGLIVNGRKASEAVKAHDEVVPLRTTRGN